MTDSDRLNSETAHRDLRVQHVELKG